MFAVGSSGSGDARRVMCGSRLYVVGAAFASCIGTPRAKRDKAGNKEDAPIESGKQGDEIRRLERNLRMVRRRPGRVIARRSTVGISSEPSVGRVGADSVAAGR